MPLATADLARRLRRRVTDLPLARKLTAIGVVTSALSIVTAAAVFRVWDLWSATGAPRPVGPTLGAWWVVLAATSLLSLAVASRLQRGISSPLVRLTEAIRAVAFEGRYDLRVPNDSDGEVGELIRGFNDMMAEVQRRELELVEHRAGLEHTIARRTAELRSANAELTDARDRAMDASRAKTEFLANVSHEIRTPMNGVLGMTELALAGARDPEQRECLETVKASAASLLALLNDVLDFSKIESRKLVLEAVPFSPDETVREALAPQAVAARQKGLSLVIAIGSEVPPVVMGDPLRFRQVLVNLVGNALKFTEHGSVRVEARVENRGDKWTELHFAVTDTGIGIAEEHRSLIFDAFSQADGSTTRRYGGTGLGLAICASLVHLMHGRIWVESSVGQGSAFHFTADFGVADAASAVVRETPRPIATPAAVKPRARVILLAEDNVVNQRVAVGLLSARGHQVTVVGNGREAVDAVSRGGYDVVLMDLQMPVMDGLTATATIRAREQDLGGHVRIVAMTAHAMDADRNRCLSGGMDGYVPKPFDPQVLFDAVEREDDPPRPADTSATSAEAASSPIDEAQLLRRLRGDRELMTDVLRLFFDDLPGRIETLRAAIADGDLVRVSRAAHTLKGTAGTAAAGDLAAEATRIEALAKAGDRDAVKRSLAGLDDVLAPLMVAVEALPARSW